MGVNIAATLVLLMASLTLPPPLLCLALLPLLFPEELLSPKYVPKIMNLKIRTQTSHENILFGTFKQCFYPNRYKYKVKILYTNAKFN